MIFTEALTEAMNCISDYKDKGTTMTRKEVQTERDKLSALAVTIAVYAADFYEDFIGAEISRKINFAKGVDRLLAGDIKTVSKAETKAMIVCEPYYREESKSDALHMRAKLVREQINHVLNSMASRMQTHEEK